MIGRIIIGFLLAAAGFVLVWKAEWFNVNFGSISWAEEKMGSMGGSRLMYKLVGLLFLLIGFLVITNLHQQFFISVFGWLFGVKKPEAGLE